MRKISVICTIMVAFAASFTLPAPAQEPQTVAGEWAGQYNGTGGERLVFYMTLKQDGENVTGTYSNPSGGGRATTDRPITGTFKDGVLSLTGSTFNGKVTGDTMTGTFNARTGQALSFTAARTKK